MHVTLSPQPVILGYEDYEVKLPGFSITMNEVDIGDSRELYRRVNWQRGDQKRIHAVDSSPIDLDIIKAATELCKETHSACRKSLSNNNAYLKLIDCHTR